MPDTDWADAAVMLRTMHPPAARHHLDRSGGSPAARPEDLSPDDMAAIVSDVLGTPVRYRQIPGQAFRDQLTGHGVSDAMAQGTLDMMTAKDNGLDNGIPRTAQNAIDSPTTFRRWCEDALKPAVQAT